MTTSQVRNGSIDDIAKREFSINPVSVVNLLGRGPYEIPRTARYVNFAKNRIRYWERSPENKHAYPIPEKASALYLPDLNMHMGKHTQYGDPKFK